MMSYRRRNETVYTNTPPTASDLHFINSSADRLLVVLSSLDILI